MSFLTGDRAVFVFNEPDPSTSEMGLAAHTGQEATVAPTDPSKYQPLYGPMYDMVFDDGFKHVAFEDELTPVE